MIQQSRTFWYAVYTLPNFEKKVTTAIQHKGIVAYCPVYKQLRQWADRKKIIEVPAFKGYVFVNIHDEIRWKVLSANGVLNFVCMNGKPARIPEHEIEAVKSFFNDMPMVSSPVEKVEAGDVVEVNRGVLMGVAGKVLAVENSYAILQMPSIGLHMKMKVPVSEVKVRTGMVA